MCVCKHTLNLNLWNLVCLFSTNFQKLDEKSFSCQNRKSDLSIDGLITSVSLQSFDDRKRQNKFWKLSQNCNLSALLNFTSLIFYFPTKWANFMKFIVHLKKKIFCWELRLPMFFNFWPFLRKTLFCGKIFQTHYCHKN